MQVFRLQPIFIIFLPSYQIGQSKTIERFVAQKTGFMGTNEIEGAKIDMIQEHIRDIKQKYQDCKKDKKDEELTAAKTDYLVNALPGWMEKLEFCVEKRGYCVGSKLSLADITVYIFINEFFDDVENAKKSLANCPGLSSACANVAAAAASWIASRPETKL